MNIYILLQWREGQALPEFQGAFSSEEKARKGVRSGWAYTIEVFTLDELLPDETFDTGRTIFP